MAKVQVPIEKGIEILHGGPLTIGWSRCSVRSLEKRSNIPRCFKCLQMGHMARECTNADLQRPLAAQCSKEPCCPVCSKVEGRPTDHVLGRKGCSSNATGQGKKKRR